MATSPAPSVEQREILAQMRGRMEVAVSAYSSSRENQLQDLRFLAGSPDNGWQWHQGDLTARSAVANGGSARPTLTINKLPQHVKMVTNDQKQNRPSAKVLPVDDDGDVQVAEVLTGMIRHIEYISQADTAYDIACENQVTHGEGYIRLKTDYVAEDSFDQDILIGRIRNSFCVLMDPMIKDPCGADAEWCFVTEDMTKDEYDRTWGKKFSNVSGLQASSVGDSGMKSWIGVDTVRVAEYFYADYEMKTLNLYEDGSSAFDDSDEAKARADAGQKPIRTRRSEKRTIRWIKTNGLDILEDSVWPGKWIPIVRVVGNEYEVEGEIHVSGLVRNAKDPQRMINYWASQEAEALALAPKVPYIGAAGQFQGFEKQWRTANTTNYAYLEYNPDVTDSAGASLPPPQRTAPVQVQAGVIQAKLNAADDLKSVTGQYNASIGETSNERSGKAILARQSQGETGTFHYMDNLARAVRHIARQCVDLIPKIYDVARTARILGLDGEVSTAKINPNQQDAVIEQRDQNGAVIERSFNPGVGQYDVMVSTGPGYMSKRQEALDAMTQILQNNPNLWTVVGDLLVKNMDWPGAQEMAERLKKTLDPRVVSDKSPEVMELQKQIEMLTQALDTASKTMVDYKNSVEGQRAEIEQQKLQISKYDAIVGAYEAETKRFAAIGKFTPPGVSDAVEEGTTPALMGAGGTLADETMQFNEDMLANEPQPPQPGPMDAMQASGGQAPQGPVEMPGAGGAPQVDPNAMPAGPGGIPGGM